MSERDERLRAVFESIDEAYCVCEMVVDADGAPIDYRFLEVNPLFEEMTGLSQAVGRTALELVPDLEGHWVQTYARVGLGGETLRFEQGSEAMGRWFAVFAVPVRPHGCFALVFRDDTQRRAAELALVESEQRFRTLADQLPMFVWEHSTDGKLVWVNQTMCNFFGVTATEMVETQWYAESHPDDGLSLVRGFTASVRSGSAFHAQARVQRSDGVWRWLEVWGRPRIGSNGEHLAHLGTALDVTERVEGEQSVRRGAQFMRRLLDNLFSFVGVLTPDGILTEANRAPLEAAGLQPGDVIGRPFWEARWWTVDEATQEHLRETVAAARLGETVRYDVQIRGTGDELIWIDFQLAPLYDDDGVLTHLVPSGHVISERIETEQRLATALESERRSRERVELLQRNATALARAITVDEITESLLVELDASLGLDITALNVVHGDQLVVIAPSKMPAEAVKRYQRVEIAADLPGPIAVRTNQPVIVLGHDEIADRFPDILHDGNGLPRLETLAVLPLRAASGRAIGALFLASPHAGWLDTTTLDLLTSIAGQTGLALERAQLHEEVLSAREEEHAIALHLQKALLPDRVAQHPNLVIAARYLAASDLMAIGGDWYDTFEWPEGDIGITVGDVVGHDLTAATTMGRLRTGVNALMSRCEPRPERVLDAYADYGSDLGPAFATAASVVIAAETGIVRYASAGHPVPLVVHPDGTVQWLLSAVAPPLGVPDERGHVAGEAQLRPGSTVVLYSDGLVERRREPLDDGFERLANSARRHVGADPHTLADAILADLTAGTEIADDVIIVCACWQPLDTTTVRAADVAVQSADGS